jgi:hypothetical protein
VSFVDPSGLDAEPQNDILIPDWLFSVGETPAPASAPVFEASQTGNSGLIEQGDASSLPTSADPITGQASLGPPGSAAEAASALTEEQADRVLNLEDQNVYDQLEQKFYENRDQAGRRAQAFEKLGLDKHTTVSLGEFRELNKVILMNPEAVIQDTLGGQSMTGYVGTVDDVQLVVFVYNTGMMQGLSNRRVERSLPNATTVPPFPEQLASAGLTSG